MLLQSMVAIKFCFVLDTHDTDDTDAIAMNKLCKLNFRYFTIYFATSRNRLITASLNMVFTFSRLYIFLIFNSIIR